MKTRNIVMMLIVACLAILVVLIGCKKKEQPAAMPTMEEMKKTADTAAQEAKKMATEAAASIEQTTCPVSGDKIDKNVFVEYKGKKVYFCCASCKAIFEKDPEKYIAKLPQFAK
jgi:YHS domain-containing protein